MNKILLFGVFSLIAANLASGHCQIPCGIYGDDTRFTLMLENGATIRKSAASITALGDESPLNHNQIVRWVSNKEKHANEIIEICAHYFLAQRIKEGQDDYDAKLKLIHGIIVAAMKTKQGLAIENIDTLEAKIKAFREVYTGHTH
jgi:nickel superoxide dismutase